MVMKCKKNYYDILGVTPDSDENEVKTSYRHLARKYHPDVNKAPDSVQRFKDVIEAYEILSDGVKRRQYDAENGFHKTPKYDRPNSGSSTDSASSRFKNTGKSTNNYNTDATTNKETTYTRSNTKTSWKDAYSQSFFRDKVNSILDEITKKHSEKSSKRNPKNGDDIYSEITITLTEAVSGSERVLNIMHKELCPHCQGRKFINGCGCSKCNGTGVYEQNRKITVKIPAGVRNNSKLRLVGEGNPGFFGGTNGNLYITLKVENDTNMTLDGNNVLYKLSVSPFEAVLGTQVDIPSFDGKLSFSVPAMTMSGQQFRIANKGLKTNGNIGDMIITVEIQLPKNLTEEEIKIYKKLKEVSENKVRE